MLTDVPAPPRPAQQSHGIIATGPKNNYLLGKIFGNMQHGTTPRPGQERGQRMFPCFCLTFQHHQEAYHSQMRVRSKTRRCERDWFCQEEPSVWICWPAHHGHLSNVQSVANGDSAQDFQECVDNTFSPLEITVQHPQFCVAFARISPSHPPFSPRHFPPPPTPPLRRGYVL